MGVAHDVETHLSLGILGLSNWRSPDSHFALFSWGEVYIPTGNRLLGGPLGGAADISV